MSRYASQPTLVDGDSGFRGFASRRQSQVLEGGMLELAENMRLDRLTAKVRAGIEPVATDLSLTNPPVLLDVDLGTERTVSSLTHSGSTATATTSTGHGWTTGDEVEMRGADQSEYNGIFTITVTSPTTFTYPVSGSPASPATGTIYAATGPTIFNEYSDVVRCSCRFSTNDVDRTEYTILGLSARAFAVRPGQASVEIAYPQGETIESTDEASMIYWNGRVLLFRGYGTGAERKIAFAQREGTTAYVATESAHGLSTGAWVYVRGIAPTGYCGLHQITVNNLADATTWTARTSAADNTWRGLAYGNGLFVAVAGSGTGNRVMTSPDGITWTARTSAADNTWRAVAYGAGLFVAVANSGTGNRVMTSPDGITWTARTSAADNNWQGVAYGAGVFVAVASSGTGDRVMTSPDGITWTARTSAADNDWFGVTYAAGLFVAVAVTGTGNRVMTSPDGITWTARTSAADSSWQGVAYGAGVFVAVASTGTGNRVMTSPDGITWTARTSAADLTWRAVTYGFGQFVAVAASGTGNRVMTSPDGITWTSRTSAADNDWSGVAVGAGLVVSVAESGTGNRVMTLGAATSFSYTVPSGLTTPATLDAAKVRPCKRPLSWSGDLSSAFATVSTGSHPAGGTIVHMPPVPWGQDFASRLVVPFAPDQLLISDPFDADSYDLVYLQFRIRYGSFDSIVAAYPAQANVLFVLCRRSLHRVIIDSTGLELSETQEISRDVGCAARKTVRTWGDQILWVSDRAVQRVRTSDQLYLLPERVPLSNDVQDLIDAVNWAVIDSAAAIVWNNRYYLALPEVGEEGNTLVLIFNFINDRWESRDRYPSGFGIEDWHVMDYEGEQRLFASTPNGSLYLLEENEVDSFGNVETQEDYTIEGRLVSRLYTAGTGVVKRLRRFFVHADLPSGSAFTARAVTRNPDQNGDAVAIDEQDTEDGRYLVYGGLRGSSAQIDLTTTAGRPEIRSIDAEFSGEANRFNASQT